MKKFITIEGIMGVGKTTLADKIQTDFQAKVIYELGEHNPFLPSYLQDKSLFGLPTQLHFLLERFRQYSIEIPKMLTTKNVIADHSFYRDMIFAKVSLQNDNFRIYKEVYKKLKPLVREPDLFIYLDASTSIIKKRLQHRDKNLLIWDTHYIEFFRKEYANLLTDISANHNLLIIDTDNIDIVNSSLDNKNIINLIKKQLRT